MDPKILIIGASGFIGSNLVKEFERLDVPLKAMSRSPQKLLLDKKSSFPIKGDLDDKNSLEKALKGIETVYYFAHSMGYGGENFSELEAKQAQNISELLSEEQRLIYLGGLVPRMKLSPHLESRKKVGEIFQSSKAETIEFRASIVVGRGSVSFEMIRALVNRLPFIMSADWSNALSQPIALKDVISYLSRAKDIELDEKHKIFEIGGAKRLRYKELLAEYAKAQGLFRPKLHVPNLPKSIALEAMKIVIPEYFEVGSKLLESIEAHTIAENDEALKFFDFEPMNYREAIALAQDPELDTIKLSEILNKLKDHPEIPSYLAGQTLQKRIDLKQTNQMEELFEVLTAYLPDSFKSFNSDEIDVKIPFVGEIKVVPKRKDGYILLAYKPKYFFQSAGWAFLDRLVTQAQKFVER